MTSRRGARLLSAVAGAAALAGVALAAGGRTPVDGSFARATCGLGLGPAIAPDWSFFGVDPRLEAECEAETFPIAGLACPDPTHGTGVSRFLPRR